MATASAVCRDSAAAVANLAATSAKLFPITAVGVVGACGVAEVPGAACATEGGEACGGGATTGGAAGCCVGVPAGVADPGAGAGLGAGMRSFDFFEFIQGRLTKLEAG